MFIRQIFQTAKITTVDVNDYIPPEWVRFRTCQVASWHCLSLFIKNISDEEVRGEGEVGYSYGRRVMCNVTTESWGKALGIKDGSGHFGRSLKSFVLDQGIGQSQISAMQTVHASLRHRDSFVFQNLYCWERKGLAAFEDTCEQYRRTLLLLASNLTGKWWWKGRGEAVTLSVYEGKNPESSHKIDYLPRSKRISCIPTMHMFNTQKKAQFITQP